MNGLRLPTLWLSVVRGPWVSNEWVWCPWFLSVDSLTTVPSPAVMSGSDDVSLRRKPSQAAIDALRPLVVAELSDVIGEAVDEPVAVRLGGGGGGGAACARAHAIGWWRRSAT